MADLSITAADVAIVEVLEQSTAPAEAAITAGQYVIPDGTTAKFQLGIGTSAAAAGNRGGVAVKTAAVDQAVTVIHKGIVYLGAALAALSFDDPVYIGNTAGTLSSTAGTASKIVGHVVAIHDGSTPVKALRVDL